MTSDRSPQSDAARPRLNKVIALLEEGKTVFGTLVANGDFEELGRISESDYDFVIIDMEHENFDFLALRHSLRCLVSRRRIAASGSVRPDVVPFVRVPPNTGEMNQWVIKQVLDAGAYGIVLPRFGESVEAAQAAVNAMRYPPQRNEPLSARGSTGQRVRGYWPFTAARYWGIAPGEYMRAADLWPVNPEGELVLLGIVETQEAVEQLPHVLSQVQGISAVWAGPGDMSVSLGLAGESQHPEVTGHLRSVLDIAGAHGVPCLGGGSGTVSEQIQQGVRIFVSGVQHSFAPLEAGRRDAGRDD